MKSLILIFAFLAAANASAAEVRLNCTRITEGNLLEEKKLTVTLTESKIEYDVNFFGKTKTASGKYIKVARNKSLMYDGSDLTELVDQCDMGNVFVDAKLLNGQDGQIGFSVRQLGDSQGSFWINDRFACTAR